MISKILTTNVLNAGLNLMLHNGKWNLTDLSKVPKNGFKVFSCFHCAGGSTMGYKLAGFDVIGGVEIDPRMMAVYRKNHNPKYSYLMGVQDFKKLNDLPEDLYNLDILDGSPPCSSFSIAGDREKKWGKKSHFREGQAAQNLDDLFFEFIDVAEKLKPKIVVAENVKGLIIGNAKGYVKKIFESFKKAGYETQLFSLNAANMGVPQSRQRVFFIANRIGKKINLRFDEPAIPLRSALAGLDVSTASPPLGDMMKAYWHKCQRGKSISSVHPKKMLWNHAKLHPDFPSCTIAATNSNMIYHWDSPRTLSFDEKKTIGSFPMDFDFLKDANIGYTIGMSVPPFMMERIARQIDIQLLSCAEKD